MLELGGVGDGCSGQRAPSPRARTDEHGIDTDDRSIALMQLVDPGGATSANQVGVLLGQPADPIRQRSRDMAQRVEEERPDELISPIGDTGQQDRGDDSTRSRHRDEPQRGRHAAR